MKKVCLRISLEVQPVPDEIEIPSEAPGGGSEQQWRVMAKALPVIARSFTSVFPGQPSSLLTITRAVPLELSGDLKDLAEIAAKFDQLATEIEMHNMNGNPSPHAV